jgi:hypothetical protein
MSTIQKYNKNPKTTHELNRCYQVIMRINMKNGTRSTLKMKVERCSDKAVIDLASTRDENGETSLFPTKYENNQ